MVIKYADHLHGKGHNVIILSNIVDTTFTVQTTIKKISKLNSRIATVLHAVFHKNDYEIIIADIIIMVFFLSVRNKRKLFYFAQDYNESYYTNRFLRLLIRAIYLYCLKILGVPVIAVSEELGQQLEEKFNAKVTVVRNGVDLDEFYPDIDKEYLRLKGDKKVILVFAQRDYRKGFDIAAKVLQKFGSEIESEKIAVWAVGENVDFPVKLFHFGFVLPERLRHILSSSDALLYPSRFEGFGLFVLEAMACGCPVVTTDAVRFVSNGLDGLTCQPEDIETMSEQLRTILSDTNVKQRIILHAKKTAEKYNLKRSMISFEHALMGSQQS